MMSISNVQLQNFDYKFTLFRLKKYEAKSIWVTWALFFCGLCENLA